LHEEIKNTDTVLNPAELQLFDLDSSITKRNRINDISFITKDNKLIILVEHQSYITPNLAFKIFLYYIELIQLWLKLNKKNIHSTTPLPNLPTPEFYIAYNGKEDLKSTVQEFNLDYGVIKINILVKIADIRYSKLKNKSLDNPLAGYSYFYHVLYKEIAENKDFNNAFDIARQECIKEGYLKGFIEKEDFIVNYKDIFDYDKQIMTIAEEKGIEKGIEKGEIETKKETAIEMMKEGLDKHLIARIIKKPIDWVEDIATRNEISV